MKNLKPSNAKIRAANASQMSIVGQFKGLVKGIKPNGEDIYCESLIYVSDSVKGFYLSYETMIKLQIIDRTFPVVGSCLVKPKNSLKVKPLGNNQEINVRSLTSGCSHPHEDLVSCGCPQRTVVPEKPKTLPFDPIPENNEKMKNWLL